MTTGSRFVRWIRFGLRSAFALLLFCGMLFGAYRYGYLHGRRDGPIVPATHSVSDIYSREYDVADILTSPGEAEILMAGIRETVAAETWAVSGGFAMMTYNAEEQTLVVEQTWPHHVLVVDYLWNIRQVPFNNPRATVADRVDRANRDYAEKSIRHLPQD